MKNVEIYLCPKYREENLRLFGGRCTFEESSLEDEFWYHVYIPVSGECWSPHIKVNASQRIHPLPKVHVGKKCDYILTIRDDDIASQLADSIGGCEGICAKAVECYSSWEIDELPLATPASSTP